MSKKNNCPYCSSENCHLGYKDFSTKKKKNTKSKTNMDMKNTKLKKQEKCQLVLNAASK